MMLWHHLHATFGKTAPFVNGREATIAGAREGTTPMESVPTVEQQLQMTQLLQNAQRGDAAASEKLLPLVYGQLRDLARQRMAAERAGHTLQATALVHEAYMRLVGGGAVQWSGRAHFFHAAAEAMRRILIEHGRQRQQIKRGGQMKRIPLSVVDLAAESDYEQIVALDEAVTRLEREQPDVAAVVRLRFYAGLSIEETAQTLGVSARSVNREWTYARAWLYRQLEGTAE